MKIFLLIFITLYTLFAKDDIYVVDNRFNISLESVEISSNEDMTLLGASYFITPKDSNLYYGASLFGTVTGKRGGFFVGGFNLGFNYEFIKDIYFDSGLFLGGGGGGSAPQGGGLMSKKYIGFNYRLDNYLFGLAYSNIEFLNGDIKSSNLAFNFSFAFKTLYADSQYPKSLNRFNLKNDQDYIDATYQLYFPLSNSLKTDNTKLTTTMHLVGVEYGFLIDKDIFVYFESAGAMGGDSTGYMEVLSGVALKNRLNNSFSLKMRTSFGSAGGGRVKTDGGLINKTSFDLIYRFNRVKTTVGAGYINALEGDFSAFSSRVAVGLDTNFLTLTNKKSSIDYKNIFTKRFNIRVANQRYIYKDNITSKNNGLDVDLIGLKIDMFLNSKIYLSGQAFGAYNGDAGGYASGLFGIGYLQNIYKNIFTVVEVDAGAGGGGSLQTGNGSIFELLAGFRYKIDNRFSLEVSKGVINLNGTLKTDVLDIALVYNFYKLYSF